MRAHLLLASLMILTGCNSKLAELDRISPVDFFVKQFGLDAEPTPGQYGNNDFCNAMTKDAHGNIYCAGYTYGDFAETNGGGANSDPLVIKMDPKGNLIWATQLGATTVVAGGSNSNVDECEDIVVDPTGNVYCAGSTASTMAGPASNAGLRDGFVLKLNSAGDVVWVRLVGSTDQDYFSALDLLPNGDLIASGTTTGEVAPLEGVNVSGDAFATRITSEGAVVWTRQLGQVTLPLLGRPALAGSNTENISGVVVDRSGTISIGGITRGSLGEAHAGSRDFFLWRLNSAGTSLSLKQYGATYAPSTNGSDSLNSFIGDDEGNLYWAGGTTGSFADTNAGAQDVLIMKTNAFGEIIWKTQLGANNIGPGGDHSASEFCQAMALNQFSLYCTGSTFGSVGEVMTGGTDDLFIVAFDYRTGAAKDWLQFGSITSFPGGNNGSTETARGIIADSRDRIYVAGYSSGDFGGDNADPTNTRSDIFVFKLDDNHRPSTEYVK